MENQILNTANHIVKHTVNHNADHTVDHTADKSQIMLSPHFALAEFTRSDTARARGIDNTIPESLIPSLQTLCREVLEPLRQHTGSPILITSGYRCPELNAVVGGVSHSQHLKGEAADIHIPTKAEGREWFTWIMDNCTFDQLLWERNSSGTTWIHVSCKKDITTNRLVVKHLRVRR